MKIAIGMTFLQGFSGGRMHAFLLGAELAAQGHEVTFVCNQPPGFVEKLPPVPGRDAVRFTKLKFDLLRGPNAPGFDLWIIVHERSLNGRFVAPILEHTRRRQIPMLLLTFETPNWQEALLPDFTSGVMDALIDEPARLGAQILSSTEEGRTWARRYFSRTTAEDFHVLAPPITASFYAGEVERDERLLVAFTRRASPHKGYATILRMLDQRLSGYRVVLVDGFGATFEATNYMEFKRAHGGPAIDLRSNITDEEKFALLKAARALLFPSSFEGFGLPPGEALYWGTPVVAYDLPVLREVYGDEPRYVPRGDVVRYVATVHEELARTPDFRPSPAARRVGDFGRWRDQVRRTLAAVMARAKAPTVLCDSSARAEYDVVIVDQIQNWNKQDTAAAAGYRIEECAVVSFDRDLYAQQKAERDAQLGGSDIVLPVGNAAEDYRGKLLAALETRTKPWVFLTEDLIVCPAEVVAAAVATAQAAQAEAAAIPVRLAFQDDGERHYRAGAGTLLAACGVFRREFLIRCLRQNASPGCRAQPVIDVSFLVTSCGGRIVPAPGLAEHLPPRSTPAEFDQLPAMMGSWHHAYRLSEGVEELLDPLPCHRPDDPDELAFLLKFRRNMLTVLVQEVDRVVNRGLLRSMLDELRAYSPIWRATFDEETPARTLHRFEGGYVRYGRCFLSGRHMHVFLRQALLATSGADAARGENKWFSGFARELQALADEFTVVD